MLCWLLELCHWRLFFRRLLTWRHLLTLLWRTVLLLGVYAAFLDFQDVQKWLPKMPTITLDGSRTFSFDAFMIYLTLQAISTVIEEAFCLARTYAYDLPGRMFKNNKKFFEGAAFGGVLGTATSAGYALMLDWPAEWASPLVAAATLVAAVLVAVPYSKLFGKGEASAREARYLIHNCVFWALIWLAVFIVFYEWIVPVVIKVRPDTLCLCPDEKIALTEALKKRCKFGSRLLCTTGVVMVWLSVIVINIVWVFACFQIMVLIYGIWRGKRDRVGNVKDWTDVQKYFLRIKLQCFPALSQCLASKHNQMVIWNWFMKSLYSEWLLDREEYEQLKITFRQLDKNESAKWELDEVERGVKYSNPLFLRRPRNEEARRRIIYFLWSLQAVAAAQRSDERADRNHKDHLNWQQANRVLAMPSLTILTPCAAEPVIYSVAELINPNHKGEANSSRHPRITVLEYLTSAYPDEWQNLCNWLKTKLHENPEDGDACLLTQSHHQVLSMFLEEDPRLMSSEFLVLQIRLWASFHGQTLVRLIRGVMHWRQGLELLAALENAAYPEELRMPDQHVQQLLSTKFQFLLCHQIYNQPSGQVQTKDMELLFEHHYLSLHKFDLVYPDDHDRYFSRIRRWDGSEECIERPGPMRPNPPFPTEPKAENQNHAIPFANGQVVGVLDMNQTCPMEDAFKVPFLLNRYFTPAAKVFTTPFGADIKANDVINPYRVVGFAEWQYTRGLSMVGEVAGQAEFCFTSIHQRVCRWPLRARLHYGHPDFLDGHWVRTRGGLSHASHLVNTAEDVFAGYEVVGRGERVEYVEWLQAQKGKESAIGPAFLFEKKLAQAAAQQMRSRDLYWLNQRAHAFLRFGLFFGTYGFYIYNTLMAMSIHLYIIAVVFFALSGVTNHDLGVNQSTLAVPWLFQVGFLFSFPLIVELSIEKGMIQGFLHFLRTLPFALVYHLFQLQTKAAFFIEGLVRGKGGYIASQRGFGLDRTTFVDIYTTYASSHVHPGINLLFWIGLYAGYSQLTLAEISLRCFFIVMVGVCWIGAPILFNPHPTMEHLTQDINEMLAWLGNPLPTTKDIAFLLFEEHKRKDVNREHADRNKREVTTKTLRQWVEAQRGTSWMAWYMNEVLLGPWGDEEMWLSIVGLLFQESILGFLSYSPWLFWAYWASPSLSYSVWFAIPILLCLMFFSILNQWLPHVHENFNILKLYVPLAAFGFALHFILAWKVRLKEVFFYLLFYCILYALIVDMCVSGWNFSVKFTNYMQRTRFTCKGLATQKRTAQHEDSIWFNRLRIPRFLFDIQKLYPVVALALFTLINGTLCLFKSTLTSMLYCPAVANAWDRAAAKPQMPQGLPPAEFNLDMDTMESLLAAINAEKSQ
eukprot:NODE_19_length_4559_cov_24.014215_g17_i0.p1 GENE.NODE_19_length_4559_cov_24.014215_g17_i0~~NODE_19_length_4559_cov_24.014215_g17_i0.p1  ORF type:complete len:1500 (+),score=450.80 NODE_19_length_4559_cov_24.014215_g17_i0:393-4502(+)